MTRQRKIELYGAGAVVLVLAIIFWPFGLTKFKTSEELQQQELFQFVPTGFAAGKVTGTAFNCNGATSNPATAVRTFTATGVATDFIDAYVNRATELKWKATWSGHTALSDSYTTEITRKEGKHNLTFLVEATESAETWKVTISEQPDDHTC